MKNEVTYKYNFDFSGHGYDDDEQKQDRAFNDFLEKVMKKREIFYKPTTLDPFKIKKFISARDDLVCIANANLATVKISMEKTNVCITIEGVTIMIRSECEMESIMNITQIADYMTLKSNEAGKVIFNVKFDLARDQ